MTRNRASRHLVIAIIPVLLAMPLLWSISPWLVRFLALAFMAGSARVLWRNGDGILLGSALFILPSLILLFYSTAGALSVEVVGGATPIHDPLAYAAEYARRIQWGSPVVFENMRLAYGSEAELMSLQFTLSLFAILAMIAASRQPAPEYLRLPGTMEILAVLGLATTAAIGGRFIGTEGNFSQVAFAMLPLASFAVAQAARYWAGGLPRGGALFAVVTLLSWGGFLGQGVKPLALMLPSCLILVSRHQLRTRRQVLTALAGLILFATTSILVMGAMSGHFHAGNIVNGLLRNIVSKTVVRQGETMFCLTSAANTATLASMEGKNPPDPGYLFGILVPRTFWPEKPNYSQGGVYAVDYCLFPAEDRIRSRHSASITLLGEPLLHGGPSMLLVFSGIVAAILAGLAIALKRGPPALATSALAMTGWMVDFDQHSTLYLGNAVKVALCLLGPALLFHWLSLKTPCRAAPGISPDS